MPYELEHKFGVATAVAGFQRPKNVVLTLYIRFGKDKANNDIPEDVRFMVERKHKLENFIGVIIASLLSQVEKTMNMERLW